MADSNEILNLRNTFNKVIKEGLVPKINDNNRSIGEIIKILEKYKDIENRVTKIEKSVNNKVMHTKDDEGGTEQGISDEYNKRLEEVEKWLEDLHQKYIEEKKKRLELEKEIKILKSFGIKQETNTKSYINISEQEYEKKLNQMKDKSTKQTSSKSQNISKNKENIELKIDVVPDKNHEDLIRKQDASEMFYIYKLKRQDDYFLTIKDNILNSLNINDYLFIKEIKKFFNLSGNQGSRFKIIRDAKIDNWNGTSGKIISKGDIVYS
jgi:hypothetical protein